MHLKIDHRIDRNCHGGSIMLFIRDISSKLLSTEIASIESFYIENFRK